MNNTKHTPGPWLLEKTEQTHYDRLSGQPSTFVTLRITSGKAFVAQTLRECNPNAEADARLIAAAPELLAQLQACLHVLKRRLTHPSEPDVTNFDYIKALIAKATGGAE